ncbi:MAG: hypothetical protein II661_10670 [Bacteroidales bacterium]|nr:hypothetical protein [Bacteroidales bacterium]
MVKTSDQLSPEEYNEPVYYCADCHSLCIKVDDRFSSEDLDGSYCADCLSVNIQVCKIGDWMKEEERRAKKRKEIEWSK